MSQSSGPSGSGFPGDPLPNRQANEVAGGSLPGGQPSPQAGALKTIARGAIQALGILWNLPNTILAATIGVLAIPFGARIGFGNGAIQFLNFPFGKNGAFTFGNVQFYRNSSPGDVGRFYGVNQNLGLHEQAHSLQGQILGPFFGLAYLAAGRPFTRSNAFERAATNYATGRGGPLP